MSRLPCKSLSSTSGVGLPFYPRRGESHCSRHHSKTLPWTSKNPKSFGFNWPTGKAALPSHVDRHHAYSFRRPSEEPKNQVVLAPARQAHSHSASVGSRYPLFVK